MQIKSPKNQTNPLGLLTRRLKILISGYDDVEAVVSSEVEIKFTSPSSSPRGALTAVGN